MKITLKQVKNIKDNQFLLFLLILLLLILLPIGVYMAVNRQLVTREAAFAEVVLNFAPIKQDASVGERFSVEAYINAEEERVSAVTLSLDYDAAKVELVGIEPEAGGSLPFTDYIYDPSSDPATFTLVSAKPEELLPSGTFKLAKFTFSGISEGGGAIAFNAQKTEVVGVHEGSSDVSFSVRSGTTTSYTIIDSLCRIDLCTNSNSIELTPNQRNDGRFDINVSWARPESNNVLYFKLYRSMGNPVPENHPTENIVATTTDTSFDDTNGGVGYTEGQELFYDIDTYIQCEQ